MVCVDQNLWMVLKKKKEELNENCVVFLRFLIPCLAGEVGCMEVSDG